MNRIGSGTRNHQNEAEENELHNMRRWYFIIVIIDTLFVFIVAYTVARTNAFLILKARRPASQPRIKDGLESLPFIMISYHDSLAAGGGQTFKMENREKKIQIQS